MNAPPPGPRRGTYARAVLAACDTGALIDRAAAGAPPPDLPAAEAVQRELVEARIARGEKPVGLKIGFTNHTIWPLYGVHHPIWGPVYDTTLRQFEGTSATVSVGRFCQPRLEPEIVFGIARAPAGDDPKELRAAIDWIAPGYEIVQSPFPDWKFSPEEAVAAQSLHGALLVGPRKRFDDTFSERALASFEIELWLNDDCVAVGNGAMVLGSPLLAMCHLVRELGRRGQSLGAGWVVTTGTLTDAQPMAAGQRWQTRIRGVDLAGLELVTTA